ncbi:MAG: response regulator, partial [Candidatus Omnitrophica bacterium]|nr:response regulator [Candidatus Omnitrophota bacterium]
MSNPKTLLIIDDEEDLRDTIEYKFKAEGFNVVTAVDGLDGLEKLETVKPDLIILDMNMPRMNGLEFYEKIKGANEKPKYPVLVLTARANMEQLFRDLDVDGFMAKPFDLNELFKEGGAIIKKYSGSVQRERGSDERRARKVCIVENDSKTLNKIAIAFLESGYMVNTAQSASSAIKRIIMDVPDLVVIALG